MLTKGEISGQAKLGLTSTQIARSLDVPQSTVRSVLERLQTTPSGVNKPRSGRPSLTTPREARILLRQLRSEPKVTWRQLKRNTGINLDPRTLNVILRAHGISHWLALKRPKLTPKIALLRLKWAIKHKDWTVDQWRKIIWSDEASVARGKGKAREWVFGTPEQKWDKDKVMEIPNGKLFSIMVWGAFWGSGRSDIYLLDRDFESKKHGYSATSYIKVLDHNLAGIWEPGLLFMQDNAPIHKAKKSKLWFQEMGIEVMEWPPYSPDLNPIENLWALLKKEAYKIYPDLDSLHGKGDEAETQLLQILQRAWANIREEVIEGLISSMPRRCAAVIKAEGWHTKY